jgi:hypothetical protein
MYLKLYLVMYPDTWLQAGFCVMLIMREYVTSNKSNKSNSVASNPYGGDFMVTVAELFDNDEVVQQVVSQLNRHRFGEGKVWVLNQAGIGEIPESSEAKLAEEKTNKTLSELGIPPDTARFYIEGIKRGGQVVVVQASSERAAEARSILKQAATEA